MKKSAISRLPQYRLVPDERLAVKDEAMKKTNFENYLDEQMRDQVFAARFEQAGEAWDVAVEKQVRCFSKI
jgi:hypothetical protein